MQCNSTLWPMGKMHPLITPQISRSFVFFSQLSYSQANTVMTVIKKTSKSLGQILTRLGWHLTRDLLVLVRKFRSQLPSSRIMAWGGRVTVLKGNVYA